MVGGKPRPMRSLTGEFDRLAAKAFNAAWVARYEKWRETPR